MSTTYACYVAQFSSVLSASMNLIFSNVTIFATKKSAHTPQDCTYPPQTVHIPISIFSNTGLENPTLFESPKGVILGLIIFVEGKPSLK